MNIESNDRVVCIDDRFDPSIIPLYTALPVKDRVYVVRDVILGATPNLPKQKSEGAVRLLLVGLNNPESRPGIERGFNAERFRKLEEVQMEACAGAVQRFKDAMSGVQSLAA